MIGPDGWKELINSKDVCKVQGTIEKLKIDEFYSSCTIGNAYIQLDNSLYVFGDISNNECVGGLPSFNKKPKIGDQLYILLDASDDSIITQGKNGYYDIHNNLDLDQIPMCEYTNVGKEKFDLIYNDNIQSSNYPLLYGIIIAIFACIMGVFIYHMKFKNKKTGK